MLLADQTNKAPSSARFFIYGGLIFRVEALSDLDRGIEAIREEAGYRAGDLLKFDTRSRPAYVSPDTAAEAKRRVTAVSRELGCTFIVHIIHHRVISNQDPHQQVQWAADYVLGSYDYFLQEAMEDGICVIDNLPKRKEFAYLSDKFQYGLELPDGRCVRLDRIKLLASTCVGASHANSAMDIVLGSFRYCVNDPPKPEVAAEMLPQVVGMMWHNQGAGDSGILNRGLIIRPPLREIRNDEIRADHDNLIKRLNDLLEKQEA